MKKLILAIVAAASMAAVQTPADAEAGWRHHRGHRVVRYHHAPRIRYYRPRVYSRHYYAPAPVYYAPPVLYPRPSFGVTFYAR
ncbi:MAG TPA: hypothetical protein VEL28_06345 [Candidatus Binatia bacterium]|nr:hypothetical protein [Candidatus Binatia bacterium]